jgi:hypothetical protein
MVSANRCRLSAPKGPLLNTTFANSFGEPIQTPRTLHDFGNHSHSAPTSTTMGRIGTPTASGKPLSTRATASTSRPMPSTKLVLSRFAAKSCEFAPDRFGEQDFCMARSRPGGNGLYEKRSRSVVERSQTDSRRLARVMFVRDPRRALHVARK